MSTKVTRNSLALMLSQKMGFKITQARRYVDVTLARMGDGLVQEGTLRLSRFGTFRISQRGEKIGRNPKTGEKVVISPRHVVSFRESKRN
jgi:integration host factor subunit alpha